MNNLMTSKKERSSYFSYFCAQNLIYLIIFQYLTFYFTEEVGLSLAAASTLLLVAKIWDAVNDPIMGVIVDKTNFKSGKFIPWIRFVLYALPLALVLCFTNLAAGETVRLIFAYVFYIAFGMIYTVGDAPLFSLATVMTSELSERDKLLALGRLGAAVAAILSAGFMSVKGMIGWTGAAAAYAVFCFLLMMPLGFTAKERVTYPRKNLSIRKIINFVIHNKYLLIYFAGYLAMSATSTLQIMAAYFAKSNLGNENMTTVIMAVSIVPLLFIAPLLPKLIDAFGKRKLTVFCSIVFIFLSVIQFFVGYKSLTAFLAVSAVRIVFMQVPALIYGMFTADCVEYGAYKTGERTEGAIFSVQTLVTKFASAICSVICLGLMSAYGYVKQVTTQTAQAEHGIWIILTLVPIAGYLCMLVAMVFYNLKEQDVAKMVTEMKKTGNSL